MSYINNFNPRRMIWFNQHEPKNKMDLWLSYNRHYTDNTEQLRNSEDPNLAVQYDNPDVGDLSQSYTTDNPNQRNCDLIMKAWDCGRWVPIVGFNTTSANKINITKGVSYSCTTTNGISYSVTGNTEFHVPLFRGDSDSPDEIFDAGTLGSAIHDYVTENEWGNIFNSDWFINAFNSNVIHNNNYEFDVLIQELIDNADILLNHATKTVVGGIKAETVGEFVQDNLSGLTLEALKLIDDIGDYQNDKHAFAIPVLMHDGDTVAMHGFTYPGNYVGDTNNNRYNFAYVHPAFVRYALTHTVNDQDQVVEEPIVQQGVGIYITSGSTVNIDISGATKNQVLSYDGSGDVYWLSISGTNIVSQIVDCEGHDIMVYEYNVISHDASSKEYVSLRPWNYYSITNFKAFYGFSDIKQNSNPIYILITLPYTYPVVASGESISVIDSNKCLSGHTVSSSGTYLFTLLFGAVKVEKIETVSNLPDPI